MIIRCEWHKPDPIIIGEKFPYDDHSITGGMCEECQKKMMEEIEKYKEAQWTPTHP